LLAELLACDADLESFRLAYGFHFIALPLGSGTFCALSLNMALFPVTYFSETSLTDAFDSRNDTEMCP
jgi:hypothetical protein